MANEVQTFLTSFSISFTENTWEDISPFLYSQVISNEEIEELLHIICRNAKNQELSYLPLLAFTQSMKNIEEFEAYFSAIKDFNHQAITETSEAFLLKEYLSCDEITKEIQDIIDASALAFFSLDDAYLRLQTLYFLHKKCPVFSMENLRRMGLTESNETIFVNFLSSLETSKQDETNNLRETLNGTQKSYYIETKFKDIQKLVKTKSYERLLALLEKLRPEMDKILKQQKDQLSIRKQKVTEVKQKLEEEKKKTLDGLEKLNPQEKVSEEKLKLEGEKERILVESGNMDEITEQISRQEKIFERLEEQYKLFYEAIVFFCEKKLFNGVKLVSDWSLIYRQMLQVCDNSVALAFVGLVKTGKSTIIDSIIGESITPTRVETMTSVPVRYIHDESAVDPNDPNKPYPTMIVPFAPQLNRVARMIRSMATEPGFLVIKQSLKVHLQALLDIIEDGFQFNRIYKGVSEVLQAATKIHDLFRLAVQDKFGDNFARLLPLDWSQGLDSFLTVNTKFPFSSFSIPLGLLKLSIIDTPGMNEEGVKKLCLTKAIIDTVDVCHYVAFTLLPTNYNSLDNANVRDVISKGSSIPTLVLATNRDRLQTHEIKDIKENIFSFLGDQFRVESIYFVSAKTRLYSQKMKDFLDRNHRKPSLYSPNNDEAQLAKEWAFFMLSGGDEDEKNEYYEGLDERRIRDTCDKKLTNSGMKEPIELMIRTASTKGTQLSSKKAIEKTLQATKNMTSYLQPLKTLQNLELSPPDRLMIQYQKTTDEVVKVCSELRESKTRIHSDLQRMLTQDVKTILKDTVQPFLNEKVNSIRCSFTNSPELEKEISNLIVELQKELVESVNDLLSENQRLFNDRSSTLGNEGKEKIYGKIVSSFREVNNSNGTYISNYFNIPTISIRIDIETLGYHSQITKARERSTQISHKFVLWDFIQSDPSSNTFQISTSGLKSYLEQKVSEFQEMVIRTASKQLDEALEKVLCLLFIEAMKIVNHAREALDQRASIEGDRGRIESLFEKIKSKEISFGEFLYQNFDERKKNL